MMQQYEDAKEVCGDALLLFRMGDFYEMFHEDAKTAARVLGLTLTSRDKGENPIPMAGFPVSSAGQLPGETDCGRFSGGRVRAGRRPQKGPGAGQTRGHARGLPGTLTDDALLDPARMQLSGGRRLSRRPGQAGQRSGRLGVGRPVDGPFLCDGRFGRPVGRSAGADRAVRVPGQRRLGRRGRPRGAHVGADKRPAWAFAYDAALAALTQHFATASSGRVRVQR
jgi:DNA mismatch repair protein MutS